MKTKTLLIVGTGLLLTAAALVPYPSPSSAPAAVAAHTQTHPVNRPHRQADHHPDSNPVARRQRFDARLEQPGECEDATAAAADAIDAENLYSEAAPDSASRIALLWLDREREVRAEQALALADPTAQQQAMAELETWYQEGRGDILTPDGIQ